MRALTYAAAIGVFSLTSQIFAQQALAQQAIPVGVVTAERKPVATSADFVGRVNAVNRVEVRARVTGYLQQVLFKEGVIIKEGAPLYTHRKGLVRCCGEAGRRRTRTQQGREDLHRAPASTRGGIAGEGFGNSRCAHQAVAADQQAQGTILIDEANLKAARTNLGYTDITSPITERSERPA